MVDRRGRVYEPTVGPRLRWLLRLVFVLFALVGANSVYLFSLKLLNWYTGQEYRNHWFPWMILAHLALGILLMLPVIVFVALHLRVALKRPNRVAVKMGLLLLTAAVVVFVTGILMMFKRDLFPSNSLSGQVTYWLHVVSPLAIVLLYVLHRLAGPRIRWHYAWGWAAAVVALVGGMVFLHSQDPRHWFVQGAGEEYFFPSLARTAGHNGQNPFIPVAALSNNEYCQKCHPNAFAQWYHSVHHFSSFNNLPYRQSVLEMRQVLAVVAEEEAKRLGLTDPAQIAGLRKRYVQATRWCAGCHDPVPFFSGAFDDDRFFEDLEVHFPLDGSLWNDPSKKKRPEAHAGITCVSCHSITNINSVRGNADYTIEEPLHYPFAYSEHPLLQAINEYLIKAYPDLHKRTFLKPFHRSTEFCSVCHKVHLPKEVNHYKWIRGQNHYDSWHNSGASGFGARSFYHPVQAKRCQDCHMPLTDSRDFGNIEGKIHHHLFLGANTALPALRKYFQETRRLDPVGDEDDVIRLHQQFLRDKRLRVDLFGLRDGGEIDNPLHVLRPHIPELEPGKTYLLEVVVRNLGVGHEFTQGTADSNEVWLQVRLRARGDILLASGELDEYGYVDAWGHFLNALILDRRGYRIDRRNPKDIFVPLFNHQLPPSSSQVVHYRFRVPEGVSGPLTLEVRLQYRKFDRIFQDFFMGRRRHLHASVLAAVAPWPGGSLLADLAGRAGWYHVLEQNRGPELPITTLAEDRVVLHLRGEEPLQGQSAPAELWERWNDFGIGLLLQGDEGAERGLLREAEKAFQQVIALRPDYADAYLNLARLYLKEGRLRALAQVLEKARQVQPAYFKTAWLRGELNLQNGRLDEAIEDFRAVLSTRIPERGFNFGSDREIRRRLAEALFQKAQGEPSGSPEYLALLQEAAEEFHRVLAIDPEDRLAHYWLDRVYRLLGDRERSEHHRLAYETYQIDDNARDYAVRTFRQRHPWADRAAQAVIIYGLRPMGVPDDIPVNRELAGFGPRRRLKRDAVTRP